MVRRVGLTTDFESVRSALDAVTVVGDTSLRDALPLALHTAAPEATRRLLLIFTDGADTSSLLLFGYRPFLKQATHEAGVRVWSASSDRDLQKLFSRAIRDMRDPLRSGQYA